MEPVKNTAAEDDRTMAVTNNECTAGIPEIKTMVGEWFVTLHHAHLCYDSSCAGLFKSQLL